MRQALIASCLITPPAIWGKLPAYADFVRSGMRHGESEGWRPWLAQQGDTFGASDAAVLPAAFVLTPGTLAFAPRRFVVGVIAPSCDKVGRRHALLVYQCAHPRWVERHFAHDESWPGDWLFWLARGVDRHTGAARVAEMAALERTVQALWRLHAPTWRDVWRPRPPSPAHLAQRNALAADMLAQLSGAAHRDDAATRLSGVRFLPWADWPRRLFKPRADSAFWQQDAAGGFVNAAHQLSGLWRRSP
ncbi:MAG TPA: TagF domain-containing protein [Pseudomonas sp.]